jgi:hypothetical protein
VRAGGAVHGRGGVGQPVPGVVGHGAVAASVLTKHLYGGS